MPCAAMAADVMRPLYIQVLCLPVAVRDFNEGRRVVRRHLRYFRIGFAV